MDLPSFRPPRRSSIAPETWLIPNLAPAGDGCSCPSTRWSSAARSR